LLVNTVDSAIASAEAGLGIANLLSYQVDEPIRAGRLVEILKPAAPTLLPISLLFDSGRRSLPATRIFIDAMKARAAEQGLASADSAQNV
tara:strand:+ start:82 stop:351 length:270 start_codon:yes stop_codon:yes gene_type:complete